MWRLNSVIADVSPSCPFPVPPHRKKVGRWGLRSTQTAIVDDSFSWKSRKAWIARGIGFAGLLGLWIPAIYLLFVCPECYEGPGQVVEIGGQ